MIRLVPNLLYVNKWQGSKVAVVNDGEMKQRGRQR